MYVIGYLSMVLLILGGMIASASLIVSKNAEAEKAIKQIAPYQSWIGLALAIFGVIGLLMWIVNLNWWLYRLAYWPVYAILSLASIILSILLGLILSMNFLKQRPEMPIEKLESIEKKLKPIQVPVGIASIAVAIISFLASIVRF